MKNILGILLLVTIPFGPAVGQNVISIHAGSTASGDTGSFTVLMKNDVRINGLNFILRFDPAVLRPVEIRPAGKALLFNGSGGALFGGDRISFLLFDKGAAMLGADSGAIFQVGYTVVDSLHDSAATSLTFTEGSAADSNLTMVPFDYRGGVVLISPAVGVREQLAGIPGTFDLLQNFPNPFNPKTTIRYSVPRQSHVTIVIFNLLGQKVSILLDGMVTPGMHTITWDATTVSSGAYFCRMNAPGFSETKKLMVLK